MSTLTVLFCVAGDPYYVDELLEFLEDNQFKPLSALVKSGLNQFPIGSFG